MTIRFYLRFRTQVGQQLAVRGTFANDGSESEVPMQYANQDFWTATVELDATAVSIFRYHYVFSTEAGDVIMEGERHRKIELDKKNAVPVTAIDTWNDQGFFENAFYSAPFKDVFFAKRDK